MRSASEGFLSVLETDATESNTGIEEDYKILAKNHIDSYFKLLKSRKTSPDAGLPQTDMIGERQGLAQTWNMKQRTAMLDYAATYFFENLLEKFREFRTSCSEDFKTECEVLDQSIILPAKT